MQLKYKAKDQFRRQSASIKGGEKERREGLQKASGGGTKKEPSPSALLIQVHP